jgi:hypothetical protein
MEPCNYGMRDEITVARFGQTAGAKQIIRCESRVRHRLPGIGHSAGARYLFFNNIAPRLPKKGLRAADNGFTTQH